MGLRHLTDSELLSRAHIELDPLASTDLERELLARLERFCDEGTGISRTAAKVAECEYDDADAAELLERAAEHDLDAGGIHSLGQALVLGVSNSVELLKAISEAGYDNAVSLKADLDLAKTFTAIAADAGDVLGRLSTLTATTQE